LLNFFWFITWLRCVFVDSSNLILGFNKSTILFSDIICVLWMCSC
jgi:hypothetical protein